MDDVAQLNAITKVYQTSKNTPPVYALRDIALTLPRGQYMAIMGPSGSGKSTLMNILGCLDRPTSGQYLLGGDDVAKMSDTKLSTMRGQHLGFVFQAFNLIPQLSVEENVQVPLFYQGMPKSKRRVRTAEALERVGLSDRAKHRPAELSGGQQQRAAIARALVNRPSFLLADEPTGNLDSATGASILGLFDELHTQGLTVVMVTHDPHVATRCERVIHLLDGALDQDYLNPVGAKSDA